MIYSSEELIIWSLIYADIFPGKFPKFKVPHTILYQLFNESNAANINLISGNLYDRDALIKEILGEKNYEKELEIISYFTHNIEELRAVALENIDLCYAHNIKFIPMNDPSYPNFLKDISMPPFVIFYKGYLPNEEELDKSLAVIGTRDPDNQALKFAYSCGKLLGKNNKWNISGLAIGCDTQGHQGSVDAYGKTGAIVAHGLAQKIYPKENTVLAEKILETGGFLLSELAPSIRLERPFLVLRDRLQTAFTSGIIVVQTSPIGGTLHAVKSALETNKLILVHLPFGQVPRALYGGNISLLHTSENIIPATRISKRLIEKNQNNIKKITSISLLTDYLEGKINDTVQELDLFGQPINK